MIPAQTTARALEALLGDWKGGGNAYDALADRIQLLILDGRLPAHTRLPAERELSARLGLSRSTIGAAYAKLRAGGHVVSVRGSGSVVRPPGFPRDALAIHRLSEGTSTLNFTEAALPAAPGVADAFRLAAEDVEPYLGGRGFDPVGVLALREQLAAHYERRGLPTGPDEIVVTSGALSALNLLARALVARGDRVIVETPTYPHAADALAAAGGRLVPVAVSVGDGWDEEGLDGAFPRTAPALAYVMPDFQNPTGETMDTRLRQRLMDAAQRAGTTVIADETTASLNIDRPEDFPPLAAYGDAVLIGSAGKTLWGGLRIGWIRARTSVLRRVIAARASSDLGTPLVDQLAAARLLAAAADDPSPRREQLRAGRDFLVDALERALPEWQVPRAQGGLCLWINLGRPVSSQLVLATRANGVLLAAGPRFGLDGAFERFLRLPTGYSPVETQRAVDALRLGWQSLGGRDLSDRELIADLV